MANNPVHILITWDVDPHTRTSGPEAERSLDIAAGLCCDGGIPATFFATANAEQVTRASLEHLQAGGHEIGCHGLTHGDEEEYDRMPAKTQRAYIEKATRTLETYAGIPIRVFRSPRVKISACALELLAEYGYWADCSVCSQRIDLISSNLINPGWLRAPRRPYRPHRQDAFKAGDLPIWEVPISAMAIPFISASLNVLGLAGMKSLFRLLYAEARRTGKPIVYLGHPTEFVVGPQQSFSRRELFSPSYIKTHGLLIRQLLYRMGPGTWLERSRQLFAYMASFPHVVFMPVGAYAAQVLNGDGGSFALE